MLHRRKISFPLMREPGRELKVVAEWPVQLDEGPWHLAIQPAPTG